MFKSVRARFALRACLVGLAASVASLDAALSEGLTTGECLHAAFVGVLGGLAYAGVGAASASVEPSIGKK